MILSFLPAALDRYKQIKQTNPSSAARLKGLIDDVLLHPETGLGEPTRLEGKYRGVWVRKLSSGVILAYTFDDSKVLVVSIASKNEEGYSDSTSSLKLESFSDDEYSAVLAQMAANRGKNR